MNILLAVLAVLPTAVLLCIIYKADKVEKEPLGLMAAVFFFGAMTTISAVFLEWFTLPKQSSHGFRIHNTGYSK